MWKFIIILILVIYLLNKISVFLFRIAGRPQPPPFRSNPGAQAPPMAKPQKKGGLKGGEYVDFEEVK